MGLARRRSKRLESTISVCLLAVLVFIGVGVFLKQSDYSISQFGIEADPAPKSETLFDLSSLLPAGYEAASGVETYTADNLYEKINGKAPLYTESGFEKLFTQRLVNKNDQSLSAELYVYDMGTVENAFSVYSVQKREGAEDLPPFAFAYRTSNALYLACSKYYIELVAWSESAGLLKAMTEVAQKIHKNLAADDDTEIAQLKLFPQENLIGGSVKLYLTSAFGFERLTDTFTAKYNLGNETVTAFLSRCHNPQDAKLIAEGYYKFLIDNGGVAKPTADKTIEGKVVDFYGSTEIIFTAGPFVGGIHEADNQHSAEKLAVKLINKLSEAARTSEQ